MLSEKICLVETTFLRKTDPDRMKREKVKQQVNWFRNQSKWSVLKVQEAQSICIDIYGLVKFIEMIN